MKFALVYLFFGFKNDLLKVYSVMLQFTRKTKQNKSYSKSDRLILENFYLAHIGFILIEVFDF